MSIKFELKKPPNLERETKKENREEERAPNTPETYTRCPLGCRCVVPSRKYWDMYPMRVQRPYIVRQRHPSSIKVDRAS